MKTLLTFGFFYLFLDCSTTVSGYRVVSGAIKHPRAPQKNKWSLRNLFFEERCGGVAAIDPAPQDGNGAEPAQ